MDNYLAITQERYIFFPGLFFILLSLFCLFMVVLGLGSWIGFLGMVFSVDRVWGLWCGAFWGFGVVLYKQ